MSAATVYRVVVLGGGYAGVLAANRLSQRPDVDVSLINPRPKFVERIRLHQLVAGNDDAVADYSAILADDVKLIVDSAEQIDAKAHRVRLRSGTAVEYDYLVYAVGSTAPAPSSVPGASEFAYPLGELESAQRLAAKLADVAFSEPIVVVGGGLTGIEAASEFAEAGRTVTLVTDELGPSLAPGGRRSIARRLKKLGVSVVDDGMVASVGIDRVTLRDGRELTSAATVWTAGFGSPTLAAASGLRTDRLGRLLTDETLTYVDDPSIVAAGDAASPSGQPLRMSCQYAMPLASHAADTVSARIAGRQPTLLNPASVGQCISLGRGAGTIQMSHFDDAPIPLHIGGASPHRSRSGFARGRWTSSPRRPESRAATSGRRAGNGKSG